MARRSEDEWETCWTCDDRVEHETSHNESESFYDFYDVTFGSFAVCTLVSHTHICLYGLCIACSAFGMGLVSNGHDVMWHCAS